MSERLIRMFEEAHEMYVNTTLVNDRSLTIDIQLGSSNWAMSYTCDYTESLIDGDTTEVLHESK